MSFPPLPPQKSLLDRHRVLSRSASVRVSPLCLGGMNFGDAWAHWMGECSKETAFEILDYFFSKGGNFIDTAINYQDGESEIWIGEWMNTRNIRDHIVLATKFTTNFQVHLGHEKRINSNFGGNNTKSLRISIETSLQRLQTSYVDVLYVHWWDHTTSVSELMLALNTLVRQGKVLYLGASDCPAWFVAKCNQYARDQGIQGFVVYQGQWSAANRSFERDILGLCAEDGMAIAPWGALGGGQFKPKSWPEKGRSTVYPSEHAAAVTEVLEEIAGRKGSLITSVALAYVMHKAPYVFPIVGGRKLDHLKANIDALSLALSAEDISMIEGAFPFSLGFPLDLIGYLILLLQQNHS
ncbi:NADP-dependent oxidoreductase domain-containing protein [Aspergillus cavernicola]|uniref:NADP-dependent oxidoreductase domain-containing protein n=1 Tax=Aspergillus cavernicola TaxID=176166 RepID=A0ABR4I1U9_9EURO